MARRGEVCVGVISDKLPFQLPQDFLQQTVIQDLADRYSRFDFVLLADDIDVGADGVVAGGAVFGVVLDDLVQGRFDGLSVALQIFDDVGDDYFLVR
jgi:hypothetical protein